MNPLVPAIIVELLKFANKFRRRHADKPPEWEPTEKDWDELSEMAEKTAEDYKREGAEWKSRNP